MPDLYDRKGNPISIAEWMMLFHDRDYQVLAQTRVGEVLVSTVWLGIDHGFGYTEWPVLFETIVFGPIDSGEEHRYETEGEALRGHRKIVREIRLLASALEGEHEDMDREGAGRSLLRPDGARPDEKDDREGLGDVRSDRA
jgi:hypothetical protein